MARLRSDLWCAAFMRRHNDLGHICVVARKGDPVAGQIWIEIDHLDGTLSLYTPAPSIAADNDGDERLFQKRFERVPPEKVRDRIGREAEFDPDFWLISLDMRSGDPGILLNKAAPGA